MSASTGVWPLPAEAIPRDDLGYVPCQNDWRCSGKLACCATVTGVAERVANLAARQAAVEAARLGCEWRAVNALSAMGRGRAPALGWGLATADCVAKTPGARFARRR